MVKEVLGFVGLIHSLGEKELKSHLGLSEVGNEPLGLVVLPAQ